MSRTIIFLLILIIFLPCTAMADISVSLRLERHEISLVDSVRLIVNVSGTRSSESPTIKGLDKFIVSKGGTSSQIRMVNGSYSSSVEYTFFLQPKRTGKFRVGPAVVEVDGRIYSSGIEKLTVKKSAGSGGGNENPVFLSATLSSSRAYVEEQLLYSLKLYHQPSVSNISLSMPEVKGLTLKQLGKHIEYRTKYNKKDYDVVELKFALIPSKAGKYNIYPAKMSMNVPQSRRRRGGMFDDFFSFSAGRSITMASKSLMLVVATVPAKGKPADFAGLVGDFSISSTLEPSTVKAGESVTLTVMVRGKGNVNRIPDLKLPEINDAKIYDDEPHLEIGQTEEGIEGIKTMKWAIVPGMEGDYKIPPVSISFFDTKKRAYNRIGTPPRNLTVLPGSARGQDALSSQDKSYTSRAEKHLVEELGKDVLPIHSSITDLSSASGLSIPAWLSWLLILLPALVYAGFAGSFRISKKSPEQLAQAKSGKAASLFVKRCGAENASASTNSDALKDYINSRFHMELGHLTPHDAVTILKTRGCTEETVKQMEAVLLKLENIIYTGKGDAAFDPGVDLIKLVNRIEKETK